MRFDHLSHPLRGWWFALTGLLLMSLPGKWALSADPRFFDLARRTQIDSREVVAELAARKIVLVGEHHTNPDHHTAQVKVIEMLHATGKPIAVGLEMFRSENQAVLDRWVAGEITPAQFEDQYYRNWNYPYALYRPIFEFARQNRIPLIGLNIGTEITAQVARRGFASLTDSQKGALADVTCRVDKAYMDFIRRAHGAHAHGKMDFTFFCEAQMVWDAIMAVRSLDYLKANPDATVVILAGAGHAQKMGIPAQVSQRAQVPLSVIMPHTPGSLDSKALTAADADYILLHPETAD